jgi:hypothetical protein
MGTSFCCESQGLLLSGQVVVLNGEYKIEIHVVLFRQISDFHGGDYKECGRFECGAVWLLKKPTNRKDLLQLLVTANVVPSAPIIFTTMIVATSSSEMSVITRATRLHIPEIDFTVQSEITHNHQRYIPMFIPYSNRDFAFELTFDTAISFLF